MKVQLAGKLKRHRPIALSAIVCLLVAGCASQGGVSTTTEVTTTTTLPDAITTTSTPSTTTSAPTTTVVPPTDVNDLASGSGCKPGNGESLPDGEWYGFIVDLDATEIEFDLACWFSGDAAVLAATEDGAESPPPNDYYVRNESEALRSVAVGSTTEVEYLANGGDPSSVTIAPYEDWYPEWEISDFVPGYWLTVEGGEVITVVQQYVP